MRLKSLLCALTAVASTSVATPAFARWIMVIYCRNDDCSKYSKEYIWVGRRDVESLGAENKVDRPLAAFTVVRSGTEEAKKYEALAQKSKEAKKKQEKKETK